MVYIVLILIIVLFIGCVAALYQVYCNVKTAPLITPEQQSEQVEEAAKAIGYWLSLNFKGKKCDWQLAHAERYFAQLTGEYIPDEAKVILAPGNPYQPVVKPAVKKAEVIRFDSAKATTKPPQSPS